MGETTTMTHSYSITLRLDTVSYKERPSNQEFGRISNRLSNNEVSITVDNLAKEAADGTAFAPARFRGERKNENWLSQQLLALDFDTGVSFETVLLRLREYGMDCSFAYETFSSTVDHPRFRVIVALNQTIVDKDYCKQLLKAWTIFYEEEIDKNCATLAHMFLGGKRLLYTNYSYMLDPQDLLTALRCWVVKDVDPKYVSQKLSRLDEKLGFTREKKCVKKHKRYINNIGLAANHTNLLQPVRNVDFEKLSEKVKIFDSFFQGDWLFHMELFGLATNLIYIEGGEQLFRETLEKNDNYGLKKYNIISVVKKYGYSPMRLENFSPYQEDHKYKNLLQAAEKRSLVRLEAYKTISLEEGENNLERVFKSILENSDKYIHIVKGCTGLGKTERYKNQPRIVIALPNHDLKDEISARLKVPYQKTPRLPDSLPEDIKQQVAYFYSIGAQEKANKFLREKAESCPELKAYFVEIGSCRNTELTLLTTHERALYTNYENHKTILFDEDPLQNLLSVGRVSLNDLRQLQTLLKKPEQIEIIDNCLSLLQQGSLNLPHPASKLELQRLLPEVENLVLQSSLKWDGSILQFCHSDFILFDTYKSTIYFVRRNLLSDNKKVIILSATADESIYHKLFGDRVKFYDISNVDLAGMIEQDYSYSFSRNSLKNQLDYAKEKVGDLPVITFAIPKNEFDNPVESCHFGKTAGYDSLKGKDIAVVGTPHICSSTYLLYGAILGVEIEEKDLRLVDQLVIHNGIQFPIRTYENPELRKIQFYFIESELRQAVGRARLLREPAKVILLSGYPLPEACLTSEELRKQTARVELLRQQRLLDQKVELEKQLANNSAATAFASEGGTELPTC